MLQLLAQAATDNYLYTPDGSTTNAGGGFSMFVTLAYIVIIAATVAGMWKVFVKAGKPGWAAIVPFYNNVVMLQITGKPIWWIILFFVPIVNFVVAVMIYHAIAKAFGKGIGYTVLLAFLPFVAFPLLGFGDAKYRQPEADGTVEDTPYPTPPTPPTSPTA